MKVIGLLGGMSWESSAEYYRLVNERVRERLGGFHSAHTVLYSVDFAAIEAMQADGRWDDAGRELNALPRTDSRCSCPAKTAARPCTGSSTTSSCWVS